MYDYDYDDPDIGLPAAIAGCLVGSCGIVIIGAILFSLYLIITPIIKEMIW